MKYYKCEFASNGVIYNVMIEDDNEYVMITPSDNYPRVTDWPWWVPLNHENIRSLVACEYWKDGKDISVTELNMSENKNDQSEQ